MSASLGMQATPQNAGEVLRALALAGLYPDLVARLVDATTDGWANILARGATFTWEVWNPSDIIGDSMSHGWGSTMVPEIQRSLLGVLPTGPGFATFDVAPPPAGLDWALGTVPTPRGTISVAWRRPTPADPRFSVDVAVPANSTATLTVASNGVGRDHRERPADPPGGWRAAARRERWAARLQLGSGTFAIRSATAA